jgi:hypothetical protein
MSFYASKIAGFSPNGSVLEILPVEWLMKGVAATGFAVGIKRALFSLHDTIFGSTRGLQQWRTGYRGYEPP